MQHDAMNRETSNVLTESAKQRMTCLALLYLWTPILLFILTWMKLHIAVPAVIAGICALSFAWHDGKPRDRAWEIPDRFGWMICCSILCFCSLFALCVACGLGGYAPQTGDWTKHNAILHDLVELSWPVWYNFNGEQGALVYYIGAYIVPALVGKLTNFNVATTVLLWWSAIGLFLACVSLYLLHGGQKPWNLLLIALGIFLFSSFFEQCRVFFPGYAQGSYGSNIGDFRQMTPQFVATLLTVAIWLLNRDNFKIHILVVSPLIMYSAFAFLGFVILIASIFAVERLSGTFKKMRINVKHEFFSISNIFAFVPFLVIFLYISANVVQERPDSSGMAFRILGRDEYVVFFSYTLSWILWFVLLYKLEYRNVLFWASVILLLILPLFQMGKYNDLCNKASMPAFIILCFLVTKNVISTMETKKFFHCLLLIFCLYISSSVAFKDLYESFSQGFDLQNRNHRIPKSSEDFYFSADNIKYQYVVWNLGGIMAYKVIQEGTREFYFNSDNTEQMDVLGKSHGFFSLPHILLKSPDDIFRISGISGDSRKR